MIQWSVWKLDTWAEMKFEWGWLMRTKGLQQINRKPPTGYGKAPDLIKDKVEGAGFVVYPAGYEPQREPNHLISSGSPIYGNSYCAYLNPF